MFGVVLTALFCSGLAVRRAVLNAQYECYGKPLPFELESALYFRYVRMLVEEGKLPALDKMVQYPEGLAPAKTYEIGCEHIYAALAGLFPSGVALAERVRWISAVWFCLGIPALFLWLWWWRSSIFGAFTGALFYAVSLAGVMRSTGQEISHENFALPLLIASLAVGALAEKFSRGGSGEGREGGALSLYVALCSFSAILLACALMLWDLIQFYLIAWILVSAWRAAAGKYFLDPSTVLKWGVTFAALAVAGAANPYLRAHGFLQSPPMLLGYGVLLALPWSGRGTPARRIHVGRELARRRFASDSERPSQAKALHGTWTTVAALPPNLIFLRLALVLLPLILGLLVFNGYFQSYGHFTELLRAKIMFFNHKPDDPAALTFAQRILWVPALNSANFLLTRNLFPATLPLFLLSTGIFLFGRHRPIDPESENLKPKVQNFLFDPRRRADPETTELLFFSSLSFAAFILFVRLYVFAAVGFAAVLGLLGAWAVQQRRIWVRWVIVFLLFCGVAVEAANVLRSPLRWGRAQPYLAERRELIDWLKSNAPGQPVLANFGISASLLAYAGCPIILHPKFETPEVMKNVREYGEMLFKSDEAGFRSWADRHGAALYVYSSGEFASLHPEMQMRYFVNALDPPPGAVARMFEFKPSGMRWFQPLWQNRKYRVFRVIGAAAEETAREQVRLANQQVALGRLKDAQGRAELALVYDPGNREALETLLRLDKLMKRRHLK